MNRTIPTNSTFIWTLGPEQPFKGTNYLGYVSDHGKPEARFFNTKHHEHEAGSLSQFFSKQAFLVSHLDQKHLYFDPSINIEALKERLLKWLENPSFDKGQIRSKTTAFLNAGTRSLEELASVACRIIDILCRYCYTEPTAHHIIGG